MDPKNVSPQVIQSALKEMVAELSAKKVQAKEFLDEIGSTSPESLMDASEDTSVEQPVGEAGEEVGEGEGEVGEKAGKPEKHEIKTPEDAKNVLNEAKEDLQSVIDGIDTVLGKGQEEEKKASIRRFNDRYASSLSSLRVAAEQALSDADSALKHWAFLKVARNPAHDIKDPSLRQVMNTVREANKFWHVLSNVFGRKVEATAVPPTGAEFSGDKWPNGKDPKDVEDRAWKAGAEKFHRDKKFEDARVNPAVENRLTAVDYSRDDKPFVNASFVQNTESKYDSFWDVVDTRTGKRIQASFLNTPEKLGKKSEKGLNFFASEAYGRRIVENVIAQQMKKETGKSDVSGIEFVKNELGGEFVPMVTAGAVEAREPKLKDKAKVRKYYADMFGSPEYARELTSSEKSAGETPKEGMDVEYKPKDQGPESKKDTEDVKKGPGTLSSQDPAVIKARATKAVEVARLYASRGAIPFTKTAILAKSRELLNLSDSEFETRKSTLNELPVVNEAAIKEAHIPDSESGIVGNSSEGVSSPKATVKTEDINNNVKSDAKISTSAVVPQLVRSASERGSEMPFTTVESKIMRKGVDLNALNIRRPKYRGA